MKKVIVVGAGAAGLMAASAAAREGCEVTVLERNDRPVRKVMITGKGRCNVTNDCTAVSELIAAVPVGGKFLYGAFFRFMPSDTSKFFEALGVPLKTERGGRVFPVSDRAGDIADALVRAARESGARIVKARVSELVVEDGALRGVLTHDGERFDCDAAIVATGGMSYPLTGSTGDGYALAKAVGHTITPPTAALVPLEIHEGFCSRLMGLSLRNIRITVTDTDTGKQVYTDFGEMLFTHFGVSGPVILSASCHMSDMRRGKYVISIDLKPALSPEQLDARLLRDFSENINKNYINSLNSLLPKKLVPVIVGLSGIPMSQKTNQITREQRQGLAQLLKDFRVTVTDFRPIDEAIITRGGVSVNEINPKTMESKLVKGLYFAGEVIDVNAYTGGYNLQIAFSTGQLAGCSSALEG